MTNETNPGTVEATQADRSLAHDLHTSALATWPEQIARHRLATQSQPAATVQEVGREKALHELEVIRNWRTNHGMSLYEQIPVEEVKLMEKAASRAIAALTAEPAAKAGDVYRGRMYPDDGGLKEPVRELGETFNAFEMLRDHFYPDANIPPSPQPDMGSGEAVADTDDYRALLEAGFDDYTARCALRTEADGGFCHAYFYSDGQWRFQTSGSDLTDRAGATIRCVLTKRLYATPATTTTERGRG